MFFTNLPSNEFSGITEFEFFGFTGTRPEKGFELTRPAIQQNTAHTAFYPRITGIKSFVQRQIKKRNYDPNHDR